MGAVNEYHQVEFYKDKKGEYRWRLRIRNGRIIADSAEGYTSKQGCRKGFSRLCEYLAGDRGLVEEIRLDSWSE